MKLFRSIQNLFKKRASIPYDSAGQGYRLGKWQPTTESINAILNSNVEVVRARARDIVRKNPYASNSIDVLVSNCIGTGIKPQSKCEDAEFRKNIQKLWLDWTDACDYVNVVDFYGLQALVLRSVIESGECFVQFKPGDGDSKVPLNLLVLEAEYLDSSRNYALAGGHVVRSGIEFDGKGKRVAYYMFREHPRELVQTNSEVVRVPANEILHIYRVDRPGQIRGEPWLANVLLKLHELDQYEDAELVRKKMAAMFAGFVTKIDPDDNFFPKEKTEKETDFSSLMPGTMQFLNPGEDVKFSSPADVGSSYDVFIKQQLRAIAIGMDITYEQLTGDLSFVNYSSIRAGVVEFRRKILAIQHHLMVFQFCRPVWNKFMETAILSNAIKIPKDENYAEVKWIPQGFEWVDPVREQDAQKNAVRCGFKSRAEVVSELGYDIEEIDAEILADKEREKKMKLYFDTSSSEEGDRALKKQQEKSTKNTKERSEYKKMDLGGKGDGERSDGEKGNKSV